MPFRLRSTYGPIYPIDRLLYIGRDETCQIRPPDSLVSRVHAAVWIDRGIVQVRDEHASNGTYVNGSRLQPGQTRTLRAGDQLQVGDSLFTVDGAATSAADMETLVEAPVAPEPPPDAPPVAPTRLAAEEDHLPTRASQSGPAVGAQPYPPAQPRRRGPNPLILAGLGCALIAAIGLCLVVAFFLTPYGQNLLQQFIG
jgi:predicted component of type VI protein secretion system